MDGPKTPPPTRRRRREEGPGQNPIQKPNQPTQNNNLDPFVTTNPATQVPEQGVEVKEQKEPAFVSMEDLISSHFATEGELEPLQQKSEPLESLSIPGICLQFVRATELWYHHLPTEEIHSCLPVNAGKLGRKDHSYIYYEREVTEYARSISRRTLDRGFNLSCMLINKNITSQEFQGAMKKDKKVDRISWEEKPDLVA
ncbi:hypothetical protein V494_01576 [Pseudogymnoascus sp. VKM F-4513 (FW-928)]|nr:hypothetical protein V494_01576 [Pseudogymnoascus sp. VKM F-4513 (FW-928)]